MLSLWAPVFRYFVSFVVIATFVMLNLFIMIIVEDFEAADSRDHSFSDRDIMVHHAARVTDPLALQLLHLSHTAFCVSFPPQDFKVVWSRFDPTGRMFIKQDHLESLLRSLPPPMGLPRNATFLDFVSVMNKMQLRT